jgi:hypothetical protein
MEITTFQRADARIGIRMSALGLAAMGSVVPSYAAITGVSVKPRQHSDAGNGGMGALDAWGPPV